MTRNVALLQRGIELVLEAEAREAFNQENWITFHDLPETTEDRLELDCKTAGCYAGHLVMDEGYRFLAYISEPDGDYEFTWMVIEDDEGQKLAIEDDWIGEPITIAEHVRSRLGITYDEADALFHFANTTEDLKFLVDRLCAGEEITRLFDHRGVRLNEGDK